MAEGLLAASAVRISEGGHFQINIFPASAPSNWQIRKPIFAEVSGNMTSRPDNNIVILNVIINNRTQVGIQK